MTPPSLDRFAGCLLGQALGDSLGFPVEGRPTEVCALYVERLRKGERRGARGFPCGQYTDDTQLARELLQSFVACGGFDPADYGRRVGAIFSERRIVGRGRATEQAARALAAGTPWEQAGTPAPAAGNGTAMRAAPVGLLCWRDPAELLRVARDQGLVTHRDPRCSAGSIAIAGAACLAAREGPLERGPFLAQLAEWVANEDAGFAEEIRKLEEWLKLAPTDALPLISRAGLDPDYEDRWIGISPFVVGSVLWSLYSFLRTPDDYLETICTAIACGGDVDTTAAMAGGLSGARLGLAALPEEQVRVVDRGTWGQPELLELAERAWRLVSG